MSPTIFGNITDIINHYLLFCPNNKTSIEKVNRKLILSRKREYRKRENETTELVVNSYGTFIGVNNKGLSLKISSKKRKLPATSNIKHITVLSDGVSISSNALNYCMQKGIGVDYFTKTGKHIGSFYLIPMCRHPCGITKFPCLLTVRAG